MGSARKKKRKLENEGSKVAGGGSAQSSGVQVEAERIAEGLLEKCGESKRDMGEISAAIENLRSLSTTLRPAQSLDLNDDWRLVFANDDDAMCAVGTGLHKLPLTRMQDFFLTLSGSSSLRRIQAIEVLRVLGPFPNLRNTLTGQCKSTSPKSLNIRYTSMVDGTGKKTGSSFTGEQDRVIDVSVAFVGQKALVLNTFDSEKKVEIKEGSLVFVRESDLDLALAELRVDGVEQK